ncbi:putative Tetratricopeptide repeat domain protein [uncultured Woeseiaceae bacterium]|uniref:Putative Tetratricopeptide repeat domain protein n=1 Tax=uncultured Woeseiaceae bacterium TaxID=1983305 RepID=A0A7D9D264_9GAMM|nr:putative Tetratricopeptide repeat domain protein [uncultured Woeseiaceae bacterium]
MSLFKELKRRNVFRIGAAYVVGAWLLIQVTETIFPLFGFGDTPARLIVIVLAIGFIPSLILSWVFEFTPEGLKKDADVDSEKSITQTTGRKLDRIILVVLALALGYFAFDKFVLDPVEDEQIAQSARQEGLTAALTESLGDKSIAVLPFDNRSNREEDQFFTDGIHDDLLTTIAKIGSMNVISRTSVMEYKDTIKKLPQIAEELGVANILEGGIQRSGNQVRINVQLIDAATDKLLWGDIYNYVLTAENLFAVQSEITKKIADALQTELSTDEQRRIDARQTDNLQAYEAYMRGRQLMATRDAAKLILASEEFIKATQIDPSFALAWVGVADSLTLSNWIGNAGAEDQLHFVEDAVKNALVIDNDLGEAYAARAAIHQRNGQYDKAEEDYQKAIELSPNYASAYQWYSRLVQGQLIKSDPLRMQESIDLMQKAAKLDPRSAIISLELAEVYEDKGLYKLAENQYRKTIELHPDFELGYRYLANLYWVHMGQFAKALALHNKASALHPEFINYNVWKGAIYLQLGDLEANQESHDKLADSGASKWLLGFVDAHNSFIKEDPTVTRETINWLTAQIQVPYHLRLRLGSIALAKGDIQLSSEIYLSAEPRWLKPDQWPAAMGSHFWGDQTGCIVAWLFLNTGDQELGTALLQQATAYIEDTLPLITEHPDRPFPETCYLTAGDTEKALLSIETQLSHNHLTDWNIVHQMPMYDQIRDEPRYQAAWAERERRISVQRENIEKMAADTQP